MHRRDDLGRFALAHRVGVGIVVVRDAAEHRDRGPVRRGRARGLERVVLGLRAGVGLDQLAEDVVHPVEHRRGRAEVAREQLGRGDERVARLQEGRDVGPAEPVDRLLRVADEEEVPGLDRDLGPGRVAVSRRRVDGRERHRDVDLDRVGVLELVDEQPLVPAPEPGAGGRAVLGVAEQQAREHEQVVELELTGDPARVDIGAR